jgi:hypothetical protein
VPPIPNKARGDAVAAHAIDVGVAAMAAENAQQDGAHDLGAPLPRSPVYVRGHSRRNSRHRPPLWRNWKKKINWPSRVTGAWSPPYQQAYARGVKWIGATCHYVTSDLDAGPIIEQEVDRLQHFHTPNDLVRLGRHCERLALAKGIRFHVQDRTIIDGHRAIVFPD